MNVPHVYFAAMAYQGGEILKIGFSRNPVKRVASLKWSTKLPDASGSATLLASVQADIEMERYLHSLFSPQWIEREWFKPCPTLYTLIDHCAEHKGFPDFVVSSFEDHRLAVEARRAATLAMRKSRYLLSRMRGKQKTKDV